MKKWHIGVLAGLGALAVISAMPHGVVPGVTNPNVTQDNIQSTVCVAGYTNTIRPPSAYTTALKAKQIRSLGLIGRPSDYEEDHYISLVLGGNPTDPQNLYPQPYPDARHKDFAETYLAKELCSGKISLQVAQDQVRTQWESIYKAHVENTSLGGITSVVPDSDDD